jgi:glutamate-ammonia-ligase adenylyltransferase
MHPGVSNLAFSNATIVDTLVYPRNTSDMSFDEQKNALELSPFLKQLVNRHGDWLEELQQGGRLVNASPPDPGVLDEAIKANGLDPALRRYRNCEMMRLIWRDLNRLAPVDEILADLSTLAEICLQAAVRHHGHSFTEKYGTPRNAEGKEQPLVVIGLGKLGGRELNLSSDIDIIFCYPERGNCDGRRGLDNEQYFIRLARNIIRSLSQVTADGFCFRVDTRLRPFGESGPLVSSFAALEQYYQREGRDWERYAMIKARPVGGDLTAGDELLEILRPFVYRRYIDYGAVEALREMQANVRDDAMRKDRLDDIKRGPGGIREIEFLVQTFQLLRGGRERRLQTPSLFSATEHLKTLGLLAPESVDELVSAYRFLRRTENRVQALHDQQTHRVPGGEDGLRVARAMGFDDMASFQQALQKVRLKVQVLFENSLPQSNEPRDAKNPFHLKWQALKQGLATGGEAEPFSRPFQDFVKRLNRLSLSQRASRRLDQFLPILLEQIETLSPAEEVVTRVLDLVSAICRRSSYLSLLVQNPVASQRMLKLFAASKRVAEAVTRHPALLDELIDPSLGAHLPTDEGIQQNMQRILQSGNDTETVLQELNYLKLVTSLRVAVALLHSTMGVTDARLVLSQLAAQLVNATLSLSRREMEKRHGRLPGPELAAIGYGSLGAQSLGFESDLDLIFLYQATPELSDGRRPVTAEQYHTGIARRMLSLMSATTPSGRLYSIDARLRPNGRAGMLVSSLTAFERYQQEEAWTWELQALTRARPVAGNTTVADDFSRIRTTVLTKTRDDQQIREDVLSMRERMRQQLGTENAIKHGEGGLLDIEFVAQLGVLLKAAEFPAVLEPTSTGEQLRALQQCGWLSKEQFKVLNEALEQILRARLWTELDGSDDQLDGSEYLSAAQALCNDILR